MVRGSDPIWPLPWGSVPDGLHNGSLQHNPWIYVLTVTLFQAVILLPDKESPEGGEDNRFGFEILKLSDYTPKKDTKR